MKSKERRREEAKIRQEAVKTLTPAQRLARLDERLGRGMGAKKERARLAEVLTKKSKPVPQNESTAPARKPASEERGKRRRERRSQRDAIKG